MGSDNCPLIANPDQEDRHPNGIGDRCDDPDGDSFTDYVEPYVGTDVDDACTDESGDLDAWPLDNDMTRDITGTGDVFAYVGKIGCNVHTDPSCQRLDLDMSGDITGTGDVFMYVGKIGSSCT
jgi:hypothetical protein